MTFETLRIINELLESNAINAENRFRQACADKTAWYEEHDTARDSDYPDQDTLEYLRDEKNLARAAYYEFTGKKWS